MKNPNSLLLLLLLFFFFLPSDSLQNRNTEEEQSHPYWLKFKALFNHAQSYLFPPNLDFRGGISNQEPVIKGEGEATGSKVKEAVAKSLGEGTAAVEKSAKSAAEKLKKTLSSHHQPPQEL